MRRILDAPSKTLIASLYLELGIMPIRFILIGKRLMFLHYILKCPEDELISIAFWPKKKIP